jgi:hypothetical protein
MEVLAPLVMRQEHNMDCLGKHHAGGWGIGGLRVVLGANGLIKAMDRFRFVTGRFTNKDGWKVNIAGQVSAARTECPYPRGWRKGVAALVAYAVTGAGGW